MTRVHATQENQGTSGETGQEALRRSPMMMHLMNALNNGEDIGHFGRLTFVMVAQYFMSDDEMIRLLSRDSDFDEAEAKALVAEVKGHGYNPPKREQILQWQSEQSFQICPDTHDPNSCNVYRELRFPDEVYENIEHFWQEKAEAS